LYNPGLLPSPHSRPIFSKEIAVYFLTIIFVFQGVYFEPRAGDKVRIFGVYTNKQTKKKKFSDLRWHVEWFWAVVCLQ